MVEFTLTLSLDYRAVILAHEDLGRSGGEAVRPHDIYACYNCPDWPYCKYRRRSKYMSNLDQWIKCPNTKQ